MTYVSYIFCIDPCNECVNILNSTCEPQLDGSVNCICPTGYNGTSCDNYIGGCIPNPCMNNGSCHQDIPGNFTCSCPSPLSGRLCEVDTVNDCDTVFNPCANNGTCMDNINGYSCVCADGFTSTNCTVNIDDCDPNPCMNGGSCEDLINDYDCQCVSGYAGSDCNSKGFSCTVMYSFCIASKFDLGSLAYRTVGFICEILIFAIFARC